MTREKAGHEEVRPEQHVMMQTMEAFWSHCKDRNDQENSKKIVEAAARYEKPLDIGPHIELRFEYARLSETFKKDAMRLQQRVTATSCWRRCSVPSKTTWLPTTALRGG